MPPAPIPREEQEATFKLPALRSGVYAGLLGGCPKQKKDKQSDKLVNCDSEDKYDSLRNVDFEDFERNFKKHRGYLVNAVNGLVNLDKRLEFIQDIDDDAAKQAAFDKVKAELLGKNLDKKRPRDAKGAAGESASKKSKKKAAAGSPGAALPGAGSPGAPPVDPDEELKKQCNAVHTELLQALRSRLNGRHLSRAVEYTLLPNGQWKAEQVANVGKRSCLIEPNQPRGLNTRSLTRQDEFENLPLRSRLLDLAFGCFTMGHAMPDWLEANLRDASVWHDVDDVHRTLRTKFLRILNTKVVAVPKRIRKNNKEKEPGALKLLSRQGMKQMANGAAHVGQGKSGPFGKVVTSGQDQDRMQLAALNMFCQLQSNASIVTIHKRKQRMTDDDCRQGNRFC